MNNRNDIQNELQMLGSRLPVDAQMPVFDLPEGYFENFALRMLALVQQQEAAVDAASELTELSPLLARLPKTTPFSVPQDYFAGNLVPPAAEDPQPQWFAAARTNPYAVPQGYFENFAAQMLEQVAPPRSEAKVIPMFGRPWVRYAAAALVVGAVVLGALQLGNGEKPLSPATAPEEWVAKKLDDVSSQELDEFILATEPNGTETARQVGGNQTEVRKLLNDVPNGELDAFLNGLPVGGEQIN